MPKKILFLAAQLQPFLVSGITVLMQEYDVAVLVYCVQHKNNQVLLNANSAQFKVIEYFENPMDAFQVQIKDFAPDVVFCSGWMYPKFVKWCRALSYAGVKTVCAMDTQWKGNLKQKINVLLSPFYLKKSFSHAWVPGERQMDYALKLGFREQNILSNLYAPNTQLFAQAYTSFQEKKSDAFSKKFLYVGRLEEHKLKNLLLAFHRFTTTELSTWRLSVIGDGMMALNALFRHQAIDYSPFLSQQELIKIAKEGAVFCLCSSDEPWGTVVQEFAAAGMPLLVSKQCGSSDFFVRDNGILCDGESVESIYEALLAFMNKSDSELFAMSAKSHQLGISSSSYDWAKSLMSIC